MMRGLFRLGLLLVAGAIVNVAVAWGCAVFVNPFQGDSDWLYPPGPYWTLEKVERMGAMALTSIRGKDEQSLPFDNSYLSTDELTDFLPPWSNLEVPSPEFTARPRCVEIQRLRANGWPRPCLWCQAERVVLIS